MTGQRNNEDSLRKGQASAARRRRAVERGDDTGAKPDGYMRVVDIDGTAATERRRGLRATRLLRRPRSAGQLDGRATRAYCTVFASLPPVQWDAAHFGQRVQTEVERPAACPRQAVLPAQYLAR